MKHFKVIAVGLTFVLTMHIQHLNNTRKEKELNEKYEILDAKIKDQYERIDAFKFGKAVFEATIIQVSSIQTTCTKFMKTFVLFLNTMPFIGKRSIYFLFKLSARLSDERNGYKQNNTAWLSDIER